ncbi:hypothetical protein P8452_34981 [Trifolium repens]|nr:hypothetical protein P8452_34981 [Trifolium repens]
MTDSIMDRNSKEVRCRLITTSDLISAIVVKQNNNNSGKIEYQFTSDGYLRDAVMRQLTKTAPVGCLFYILTDCCRFGGFVEGLP